jgi:hypothetical protein
MGMKTQFNVVPLAVAQFRKDWPLMAARLDSLRGKACGGGASPAPRAAEGVPAFATPPSNTGVTRG